MSKYETIIYQVERGRARIILNRPEKRNAISYRLAEEVCAAAWEADNDKAVHCVILKGAGKGFSAGNDITPGVKRAPSGEAEATSTYYRERATFDDDTWILERTQRFRQALFDMHKPVIAQTHGFCLAGGLDLALMCDMIVSAEDCRFGIPPSRDLGSLPNQSWLYHMGPQWAKRLGLTGDTIDGREAAQLGLVLKAVAERALDEEVEQLADRLALIDPDLLSANKRIINLGLEMMGARTLMRLAAENDARAHLAASAREFRERAKAVGLKQALTERDAKFGDGKARVNGPEIRDEKGRLKDL